MDRKITGTLALVLIVVGSVFGIQLWRGTKSTPELSYDVIETRGCCHCGQEALSVEERTHTVQFSQELVVWSGAENWIILKLEKDGRNFTIWEIYNSTIIAACLSLYDISGKIQGLEKGRYTLNFIRTTIFSNKTEKLYERTVNVKGADSQWMWILLPSLVGGGIGGALVYFLMRRRRSLRKPSK